MTMPIQTLERVGIHLNARESSDQLLILYAGDPLALITGDTIEPITTDMSRLFAVLNQLRAA